MTSPLPAVPRREASDLVRRLQFAARRATTPQLENLITEAADRIEALEAALATANSALSVEIALRNEIARQVAAQRKEECTCTQLASNSFDEPPEYETDPACPIHGRALEAAAAQTSREIEAAADAIAVMKLSSSSREAELVKALEKIAQFNDGSTAIGISNTCGTLNNIARNALAAYDTPATPDAGREEAQ